MERVLTRGVVAVWDSARRLVVVDYLPGSAPTDVEARELVAAVRRWTGPVEPYRLMSDVRHARAITAGYRAVWADHLRADRHRVRVAVYHLSPFLRVMAHLAARASGADMRVLGSRAEALAWLGLDDGAPAPLVEFLQRSS